MCLLECVADILIPKRRRNLFHEARHFFFYLPMRLQAYIEVQNDFLKSDALHLLQVSII